MPMVVAASVRACCAVLLAAAPLLSLAAPQYVASEIQSPQGQSMYAIALNDHAQVVGRTNAKRKVDEARAFVAGPHTFKSAAIFGADLSFALAINNAGDVVGHYTPDTDVFERRAFLQRRGQAPINLFAEGEFWISNAMGINRHGMVVGAVEKSGLTDYQAFVWQNGAATLLVNTLGGSYSTANAVNDSGVVVGTATDADGFEHAFRYENGQMVGLPTLVQRAPRDWAYAVNAVGDVAGACLLANFHRHACVWKDGGVADLGALPDAEWSNAFGINDAGVAVGQSGGEGHSPHAVVFRDGQVMNLNTLATLPPGVHLDIAIAINEAGQIVAQGKDAEGLRHSYRLEPVPAH
jgi:probable HAF family extracellular repeat protein